MEKGATKFDKLCHKVFSADGEGGDFRGNSTGIQCGRCGRELFNYYCENRLYVIECRSCNVRALVKANAPEEAAYSTLAHAVYPLEAMGEDCAVFFAHTPINEPPVYVGQTIDTNFPDDVVCGMYLPCPGLIDAA